MTTDEKPIHPSADDSCQRAAISRRGAFVALSVTLVLLALPTGVARAAEPAPLRVKFTKGQTLRYVMTINTSLNVTKDGNELNQSMANDTVFTWKVLDVAQDGLATIEQANERSRLAMKNPGLEIDLDTANPADDKERKLPAELQAATRGLRNMVDKPIELTVNPRGEIEKIKFSKELLDAVGMTQEFMQFGFKRDKPLKRLGELGLIALPAKPLAVGEAEEETKSVDSLIAGGAVKYRFKYTRRPDERIAGRALAKVDYALDFDPASVKALGGTKYEVSGSIHVDPSQGVITGIDFRQVLGLNLGQATGGLVENGKNEQVLTRTTRLLAEGEDPFAEKPGE
ncbi:MAG: hypothetical protein K2Y37_04915 [Pirellulales bacterium]|nr:hypothetical protein [Pirellulales bacterium]